MLKKMLCTWLFCLLLLLVLQDTDTCVAATGNLNDFDEVGMEDLYGDDELVSIATGSSKPIYKAPAVASVITATEIAEMGARNLNDILETVPGLHVGVSAINRMDSIYSIRGIHTGFNPQVLVLMNGIPFGPPLTGSHPTLFRLPVSSISRVEIIRGPGSAVYGADAYAGVINIITKDATELETKIGGRFGSFDSKDLWLAHNATLADWNIGFSFEWQKSDGDKDRKISSDYQSILDSTFATNYSLAPGSLNTDYEVFNTLLTASKDKFNFRLWNWHLADAGVGAGGSLALDPVGSQEENLYLFDVTYSDDRITDGWGINLNLHYLYQESDIYLMLNPPGIYSDPSQPGLFPFPDGVIGNPNGIGQQVGLDFTATFSGFLKHRIRLGVGTRYQDQNVGEAKNFGTGGVPGVMVDVSDTQYASVPDSYRHVYYLSMQDEWQYAPDWELTAGVRYDHYSDFGSTVNPRLAIVWSTRHNLTTKLLYGRAFRAPSFQEQFAVQNPVTLGNPDLDPETIDTVELAFDYRPTFSLQTTLNLFIYKAEDLIEYVPSGGGTNTAQNSRDQDGYGFEVETTWDATSRLRFTGNYAWQYAVDSDTDKRIPDAPGQQAFLNMNWKFYPDWSFYSHINWVGKRKRASTDSRANIDDYVLVDLSIQRKAIFQHLDLALTVRNIFDEDAREPSDGVKITDDYPLEGRSLWCEFVYRF